MKTWNTPKVVVEEFEANEYVAACYNVACGVGTYGASHYNSSYWTQSETGTVSHSKIGTAGTCGDADANRVVTDALGVFESVGEYNSEQGWLDGTFYGYEDKDNSGTITPGDVVYWCTESKTTTKNWLGQSTTKVDRRWNHAGVVELADASHPNHS